MEISYSKTRINGRDTLVPSTVIEDRSVIVTGRFVRIAQVQDESCVEDEIVPHVDRFIAELKNWDLKPDLFTFRQKVDDLVPRFDFHLEWEHLAVIPITTYQDWLKNGIKRGGRVNLNRARREGVVVRPVQYDDDFVRAIKELYDETPVRQRRHFWHYRKSFEEIKEIHGTYCERAEYIGAYFENELIGFIKMVYVGSIARTMNVIGKERYFRKRPTNALIAKAVEVCAAKGIRYLNYGHYRFPGRKESSLSDFKRRNGFQEFKVPRYYMPLTRKGKLILVLRLHRDPNTFIPWFITKPLLQVRSLYFQTLRKRSSATHTDDDCQELTTG